MEECNEAAFFVFGPSFDDIARHRLGARNLDDELSQARYAFDCNKQFELSLDPETAMEYHDQTLPADIYK